MHFGKLAMAKILHSMIRVIDENKSVDFYRKAFGLEVAHRFPFDGFTLVYLRNPENDFELELTINNGRTEPYSHGDGYGHLAVAVSRSRMENDRFSFRAGCSLVVWAIMVISVLERRSEIGLRRAFATGEERAIRSVPNR